MGENEKSLVTVSADMRINASPEAIWPQLCPVREYDWIEVWECELVHSVSGFNELGCVFRTDFPADCGLDTWVTNRFEENELLEFVRINEHRAIRYVIELKADGDVTDMTWTQHVTPLTDKGREIAAGKPHEFSEQMAMVGKMLNHYLTTGTMLKAG